MVRKTPRKGRAPGDYGHIGEKGRRTGVTLEDTGVRDEHGMEPIPSFSSPQKLDAVVEDASQQDAYNGTYTGDESMEMAQSTIVEPLEYIRSAKTNRNRSLPRSKSPRKSLINGSPRRSVGLLSSPSKNVNNGSPSRSAVLQPPNRQLDFSIDPSIKNGVISPHRMLLTPHATGSTGKKDKNKRPFDLTGFEDSQQFIPNDENAETYATNLDYDDGALPDGDEALQDFDPSTFSEHIEQSIEQDDSNIEGEQGDIEGEQGDIEGEQGDIEGEQGASIDPEPLSGSIEEDTPASSEVSAASSPEPQVTGPDESHDSILASAHATRRKRGNSNKHSRTEVYEDPDVASPARPVKRRGDARGKNAPKERDPNARPKPATKPTPKGIPIREGSAGPRGGTYLVQRSETPATDNGAIITRSGRTSYKPLASWRGEKAIYGQRPDWETPASVTDIIRTDEVQVPPQPRRKAIRKARAKTELEGIEEEPEALDTWETETGIMYAQVMRWDQETGKYDENEPEEAEVAYAAPAIEMRDIAGANFKFAKTLTTPFFGSGMVHLPPRGEKRVKNSRKMQMVFFVHQGRVTVDVGTPTTTFSIGKGGQWQVPRGNFYSISNESDSLDARIFFAQGCEWAEELADETAN